MDSKRTTASVSEATATEAKKEEKRQNKRQIIWVNVGRIISIHVVGGYGLWQWISGQVLWGTILFTLASYVFVMIGALAGGHRLWSHNSYKAKLPLRLLLCFMQTMASQKSIYNWCRDHRLHHKYTDTCCDPHDASRGFFYSHVGWIFLRKSDELKEKGRGIYLKDLEQDPVVMFQHKHYNWLSLLIGFALPWLVPVLAFGEAGWSSWNSTILRYVISLHCTWLINSAAHLYGSKPYDKSIRPTENKLVSALACGEGWHNYHHSFPWDYKASELTWYRYNLNTAFIDFFAWVGWAYDLKTVSEEAVLRRAARTGDGSHLKHGGVGGFNEETSAAAEEESLATNKHGAGMAIL